jgi:hypothetical protein
MQCLPGLVLWEINLKGQDHICILKWSAWLLVTEKDKSSYLLWWHGYHCLALFLASNHAALYGTVRNSFHQITEVITKLFKPKHTGTLAWCSSAASAFLKKFIGTPSRTFCFLL